MFDVCVLEVGGCSVVVLLFFNLFCLMDGFRVDAKIKNWCTYRRTDLIKTLLLLIFDQYDCFLMLIIRGFDIRPGLTVKNV
jgi:hypothetical protein